MKNCLNYDLVDSFDCCDFEFVFLGLIHFASLCSLGEKNFKSYDHFVINFLFSFVPFVVLKSSLQVYFVRYIFCLFVFKLLCFFAFFA